MGYSYALHALHDKRARIAGEIEAAERTLAKKREALATLDAVIRMFEPECRPDMIPSIRPYLRGTFFGYRELTRLVIDVLREAGKPVSLAYVVDRVVAVKGFEADARLRRHIGDTARASLIRMERAGKARRVLEEPETWWELVGR
jgi:hypothetical protein